MSENPTYEELIEKVKELEQKAFRADLLEKELNATEEKYRTVLDEMDVVITIVDAETHQREGGNKYLPELLGYEGSEFHKISPSDFDLGINKGDQHKFLDKVKRKGPASTMTRFRKKEGDILDVLVTYKLIRFGGKDFFLATGRDVTDLKKTQRELQKSNLEMESRVQERTAELLSETIKLEKEIIKRRKAERELIKRREELKINNVSLEEMNTALKILLRQRGNEKKEMEENIASNLKELVEPYLEQLKKTRLNARQEGCLDIVESNLKEVVSPFIHRMLDEKYSVFTPREIQVANLVKVGKSSKEIAALLSTEVGTIEYHRKNIRKKLGLKSKDKNLRSYLLIHSRK